MRTYEIYTLSGIFTIKCDELALKDDFLTNTTNETLCLFTGKRLMAMFREWNNIVDITETKN